MVSLGSSLVTTLTGLTTVSSQDLISLTIKPKGLLKESKKQQRKYLTLCLLAREKKVVYFCFYLKKCKKKDEFVSLEINANVLFWFNELSLLCLIRLHAFFKA